MIPESIRLGCHAVCPLCSGRLVHIYGEQFVCDTCPYDTEDPTTHNPYALTAEDLEPFLDKDEDDLCV